MKIHIKPLSVNRSYGGRKYKTNRYRDYQEEVLLLLPKAKVPTDRDLKLTLEFGLSSKVADIDNPIKPFVDILQIKYGFNDRKVMEMCVKKVYTKKGKEYIKFNIETL